jgi:hypothetical protein
MSRWFPKFDDAQTAPAQAPNLGIGLLRFREPLNRLWAAPSAGTDHATHSLGDFRKKAYLLDREMERHPSPLNKGG